MAEFKFNSEEFDSALHTALGRTYAVNESFASEAAFKYELFHQLYDLKVGNHKLGVKLPGASTCMLHAESSALNGLRGQLKKADMVVCDPTRENMFNCRVESAIELKKSLSQNELTGELEKFAGYEGRVPGLYVISANESRLASATAARLASSRQQAGAKIRVLCREDVPKSRVKAKGDLASLEAKGTLAEQVTQCIKATLDLYGHNSGDPYHSFFWRNYEYENEMGWTFPCEGDFTAQLYHLLRSRLGRCVTPEYRPVSATSGRVDLFVERGDESVGIEIKMNYDNFKGRGDDEETAKIARKFNAMDNDCTNHRNLLVVIQGQHAHKGTNKETTLIRLRQRGARFGLMSYCEMDGIVMGPEEFGDAA